MTLVRLPAVNGMTGIVQRVHSFLPVRAVYTGPQLFIRYASSEGTRRPDTSAGAASAASASAGSHRDHQVGPRLPQTLRLDNLRDNPGANKPKRKKGRGVGGGHGLGRTGGEGSKGQKSHQGGGIPLGFEGGQSPLWRRTPKFGYMPKAFRREMDTVNLNQLQHWIDTGRIDVSKPVTIKTLVDSGIVNKVKHGVKLLGTGAENFKGKIDITVSQASGSAIAAVEANGGSIVSVYLTDLALRSVLKSHRFPIPMRAPAPPPKIMRYYTEYKNRGYLSPELQMAQLKARLSSGMPLPLAAALHPVFVGGAPLDEERHLIDIDVHASERVAAAQMQTHAEKLVQPPVPSVTGEAKAA